VTLADGSVLTGMVVENGEQVSIYPADPKAEPTVVDAAKVKEVELLPASQMPPGLLNILNPEEVRDLMAYLMAGGNKDNKIYKR
jgi:hypothetical protein